MTWEKQGEENSNIEIRNPKQIQNDEKQNNYNAPNGKDRIQCFGFSDFEFILAAVCFEFRYSDFEFGFGGVLARDKILRAIDPTWRKTFMIKAAKIRKAS